MKVRISFFIICCVSIFQQALCQVTDTAKHITPVAPAVLKPMAAPDDFNPTDYLGISIGRSFAFGKYKDSGLALSGFNVSLSGGYNIKHSGYGIGFKFDYDNSPLDQVTFANILQSEVGRSAQSADITCTITKADKWTAEAAYIGLYATYPNGKLSVDIRVLGGIMYAISPEVDVNILQAGNIVGDAYQTSATAVAPSLSVGGSLRYICGPNVALMVGFDFLYADPKFDESAVATVQTQNGQQSFGSTGTYGQVIAIGNLSFGIAWIPPVKTR